MSLSTAPLTMGPSMIPMPAIHSSVCPTQDKHFSMLALAIPPQPPQATFTPMSSPSRVHPMPRNTHSLLHLDPKNVLRCHFEPRTSCCIPKVPRWPHQERPPVLFQIICPALSSCGLRWGDRRGFTLTPEPGFGHCELGRVGSVFYTLC